MKQCAVLEKNKHGEGELCSEEEELKIEVYSQHED